jgi:predicted transcriptional regulator
MQLSDIVKAVNGDVRTEGSLETEVGGCYVSDLCSDVLANSSPGDLWVTQHTHSNIVVVAAVKELAGVVIVGNKAIDPETLKKADSEKVPLISTELSTFEVAGMLYNIFGKGKEG